MLQYSPERLNFKHHDDDYIDDGDDDDDDGDDDDDSVDELEKYASSACEDKVMLSSLSILPD